MGPSPPCCSPRTTEPSDPAEPWGLAIKPPRLPRLAHHARADASRSTVFRDPCAALASPGRSGGVVRHPCHGSPSLPRSAQSRADRAPVPDPRGFRPSAGHSWPAAAGALHRSRGAHLRPAPLRAARRGPDPGCQSAAGAWASGPGAGALRLTLTIGPPPGRSLRRVFRRSPAAMRANRNLGPSMAFLCSCCMVLAPAKRLVTA